MSLAKGGFNCIFTLGYLGYYFLKGSVKRHHASRLKNRALKRGRQQVLKRLALCVSELGKNLKAGAAEVKFRWGLLPRKQRASFVKFSAAGLLTLSGYFALQMVNKQSYPPSWPHPERRGIGLANFKRDPTCAPFEHFKNPKLVLFLTSGEEGDAVSNQIVKYLSAKEDFIFPDTTGSIKEGCFYPRNGDPVRIFVINTTSANKAELNQLLNGQKSNLIFYRGHTNEMIYSIRWGSEYEDKYCLGLMGGCNSASFINQVHTPETPTAGVQGTGFTERNTHWSWQIIVALCDQAVGSWRELQDSVCEKSKTARLQLVFPGTDAYNNCFSRSTD